MSFLKRLLSHGRVRSAAKRLSDDPSPKSYSDLAQEHAVHGEFEDALSVAEEGMKLHASDGELKRVHERIRQMSLEGRMRELTQQLKRAPRPAVWSELCQILVESGRVARAEDTAIEWYQSAKHPEAQYWRARCLEKLGRTADAIVAYGQVSALPDAGFAAERAKEDLEFLQWRLEFDKSRPKTEGTKP